MMKEDDDYVAVHGASSGILRVDVLNKPVKGTRRDFIRLSMRSSRKRDKAVWHAFTDWEALQVARMLLWAVSRRSKQIKLEEMR